MLELNDPLWNKLDDAFRDEHIPTWLSRLAVSWNDETVNSLLFGVLWHQGTCYGATYAAVPHLLKIAEPEENRQQRLDIALFLGQVALDGPGRHNPGTLQGLPETVEGWDRKLDCYRSLVAFGEQPNRPHTEYELTVELPRYKEILAIEPVNASDLEKILSIKAEFYSALPAISALCERALHEHLEDCEVVRYLLSGIAAADGLIGIASLLNYGRDGQFSCASCGWAYEFILFGERIAVYADAPHGAPHDDKGLSDFKDGAPSRADGFIIPIAEDSVLDARVAALLALAKHAPSPEPALLLRHFAGSFVCCKCGVQGPMQPPS